MKRKLSVCLLALTSLTLLSVSASTTEDKVIASDNSSTGYEVPCDTVPCDTVCTPAPCNPAPCNPAPCC